MPVSPEIGGVLGDDDQMPDANLNGARATRAQVWLAGGVRLDDRDDFYPQRAHASTPAVITSAAITTTMSVISRSCDRNGLKPIAEC